MAANHSSGLSCGIVGLPNVGKSTLFNALTSNEAPSANYPFCTIEPNVGVVEVEDARLAALQKLSGSSRLVPEITRFTDIAGLVKGASQGEGLGNTFLSHIRETNAIVQVVRCFDSSDIIHVSGNVDPLRDIDIIGMELILADLQMCENSLSKVAKQAKTKKELQPVVDILQRISDKLNENVPVRALPFSPEELELLRPYPFITGKKQMFAANVSENDLPSMRNKYVEMVEEYAAKEGSIVIPICARIEEEIAQLPQEERMEFLQSLGLQQSGLQRLIHASFEMLGLITFLTTGEMETRAWAIRRGCTAWQAAGEIHGDIQKHFIKAEVIAYDDFVRYGGRVGAKEAGKARYEGKEYIVQDGDVMLFMHSG